MSLPPTSSHQLLLSDLHALIYFFLKDAGIGKVIPSPIDVYLENYDSAVQPDLVIILNEHLHQKKQTEFTVPRISRWRYYRKTVLTIPNANALFMKKQA